jgi:hypothetical protein
MIELDLFGSLLGGILVMVLVYSLGDKLSLKTDIGKQSQHPFVSTIWQYAPRCILNLIYTANAKGILQEGYQKVWRSTVPSNRGIALKTHLTCRIA